MANDMAWQRPTPGLATAGSSSDTHGNHPGNKSEPRVRITARRQRLATRKDLNDSTRMVQQRIVFCNGNLAVSKEVVANKADPDDPGSKK